MAARHQARFDAAAVDEGTRRLHRRLRVAGVLIMLVGAAAIAVFALELLTTGDGESGLRGYWLVAPGVFLLAIGSACLTGHVLQALTRDMPADATLWRRVVVAVERMGSQRRWRPDVLRRVWPDPGDDRRCTVCGGPVPRAGSGLCGPCREVLS